MRTGEGDLRGVCTRGIEWSGRPEPTTQSRGDGVRAARRSQSNPLDLWSNRLNEGICTMERRSRKHRHRWGAWVRSASNGREYHRCQGCKALRWRIYPAPPYLPNGFERSTGHEGTCVRCIEPITPDQLVETDTRRGWRHLECSFPKAEAFHIPEHLPYGRKRPRGQLRRGVPGRT